VLYGAEPAPPAASVSVLKTTYCFSRIRRINAERTPLSSLVLQLHIQVTYHNPSPRPLIVPMQYERSVYTALAPGVMKKLRGGIGIFDQKLPLMKKLPPDVSADSPVDPPNNVFAVIRPRGDIELLDQDDVQVTVYHPSARPETDLRGHRLYVRLQFEHQPLAEALQATLSDRWSRFGVPWTGKLRTNTLVIDIPASPAAADCVDTRLPDLAPPTNLGK
jgi:hypothetical protein